MPSSKMHQPLIVIVGPTAAGKTAFAVQMAERLGGEIISADSRQFYRGMDIGTAKPTREELKRVRHHLIDIALPNEVIGLADFQKLAAAAIADIHGRNRLPFLVGGTGQYVKSIVEGWRVPTQPPHPKLREAIEAMGERLGRYGLHQKLQRLDPEAASMIQPQNMRRTVRALEVILSSGRTFSEQRKKAAPPYAVLTIGIWRNRRELYDRIDTRIDAMISEGLLEETHQLLQQGFQPDLPALSAIGYKEMTSVLQGAISVEEAVVLMKRRTREFIRRQANWFKETDPQIHWLDASQDLFPEAVSLIRQFLDGKHPTTDNIAGEEP